MIAASRLRSLWWFAARPWYVPHAVDLLVRKLGADHQCERPAAEAWCRQQSVNTPEALRQITGSPPLQPFVELFRDLVASSRQAVEQCPVRMGGAADLDLLYNLARYSRASRVIETGVASGWSSLALLQAVAGDETAKLISIDLPYLQQNLEAYVGCAVPQNLRGPWQLVRQPDRMALRKAIARLGSIDLCHYDSDKSWHGRMWAYPLLWQALRQGGIFISDDIGDNLAFRSFCETVQRRPVIVAHNNRFVGILQK